MAVDKCFLNSQDILVFPSTRRSNIQATARYQQESTFSDVVRHICDSQDGSFIFTQPVVKQVGDDRKFWYDLEKPFEFFIHGYWFRANSINTILNACNGASAEVQKIYAYIDLDKISISPEGTQEKQKEYVTELKGIDDTSNKYLGLKFTVAQPEPESNRYSILLFDRAGATSYDNWAYAVVLQSLYKFNHQFSNIVVDGGEIL